LYWFVTAKNLNLQNALIVVSSFVFYGWWDWRFLSLLLFSSLVDFGLGLALQKESNNQRRKLLLGVSLFLNLGLLGFFKYFNFFIENFKSAFTFFGRPMDLPSLDIILPVGISFYTFQTLSYGIDVYRRKLEPTKDLLAFLAFVSFFPQLVAGPIERATHLLPQFYSKRVFNYDKAVDGMRLILWGFFKKIVIADNAAIYVNDIFENYTNYSASTLIMGSVLFSFQIYCDFSGYSDIAIGTAKLFGFELFSNFKFPYFSRDLAEFWRRWHISLSTWFRDYLYIPLGGNRVKIPRWSINILIVFMVSGLWHGANWTFVVWGALHGLMLLLERYFSSWFKFEIKKEWSFLNILLVLKTFIITSFIWIFFRAENFQKAKEMFNAIFNNQSVEHVSLDVLYALLFTGLMILFDVFLYKSRFDSKLNTFKAPYRWAFYAILLFCLMTMSGTQKFTFIYFQF
jgi:D-alanyl-lipoteichoic acid acyltransferase DltB (MBOAT superfamily)